MPQDIQDATPEEGITLSHLPDHDDTETVASEFEQEKSTSPLLQENTEDFTALFKEFEREKTMSPLSKNTDVATLFDQEENVPPKIDQQQFENVHSSTQNRLPFTPLAVRRQQRKRKPYGRT